MSHPDQVTRKQKTNLKGRFIINMQTLPFSTLNQFTYREPEEIRQRLKEFLYTGGNDPHFMKGICWMQIRQEFEGVAFLKPYDYQYDLENLFEKTFWTPWHFRLLKEFCQFFGKAKWCRFCRMAKELDRRKGLEQLDFHTLANFIYACLLEAKQTEDRELRTECLWMPSRLYGSSTGRNEPFCTNSWTGS